MKALFDSNILIDHLKAIEVARAEIKRYRRKERHISIVTWIEVLTGALPPTETSIRLLLSEFTVLPLSDSVAERASVVRREHRLKLPDAIVRATAEVNGLLLVTRNSRDFPATDPSVRVPYDL